MIDKAQAKKRKVFPKVTYRNYRKAFPNMGNCFNRWFYVSRTWGGKIIEVGVKHRSIVFDFRKNWMADMCYPQG